MSKEYLEVLGNNIRYKKEYIGAGLYRFYIKRNDIDLLEKYLTELEQIKNANPSEALEDLEKIKDSFGCDMAYYNLNSEYETVEKALLKAQEQEKVLEILFKKQVDLGWLWYCIHELVNSLNEYNKKMPIEKFKLTQEEYELLKRWLG